MLVCELLFVFHTKLTNRYYQLFLFSFSELIDKVLEEDDLDRDGYLSYIEYVVGRQRDERGRQD